MKIMRQWISFLLLFLGFFTPTTHAFNNEGSSQTSSNEGSSQTNSIEQVITNDQGVFLQMENCWLNVDALQVSKEGMFVLVNDAWIPIAEALEIPEYRLGTWKCEKCGFVSFDEILTCPVCGRPRYRFEPE